MRRREFLMVMTLLTITLISAKANPPSIPKTAFPDEQVPASEVDSKNDGEPKPIETVSVELSTLVSKDKALVSAYFNTLSILSTTNECSLFFGGPAASVGVFKQLIGKVRKDSLATSIGIQMSGETVNIHNATTRTEYRLFDRVVINANGPFYQRMFSRSKLPLRSIGTFEPNTKEARVLMLLHELGHVMKGEDGNWLLPNDGKDNNLSRLNSKQIEHVCGEQIKALPKHERKGEVQVTIAGKNDYSSAKERYAAPVLEQNAEQATHAVRELKKN